MRKLKLEELGRKNIDEYKAAKKLPITVVLDDIRSGVNVGSMFRSADAFLFEKIILCGITPRPPHKEISRTAIGATHSVDWIYSQNVDDVVKKLKEEGKKIILIEQTNGSIPLSSFDINPLHSYAVVLGNEVNGVNDDLLKLADECIEIQQYGTKHSLNVSVCAGIAFWYFSQAFRT